MKTHRCEKSLKAKVSIRYEYKYANMSVDDDYLAWRLFELEDNYPYDPYLSHVAEIVYCPFCGTKLD